MTMSKQKLDEDNLEIIPSEVEDENIDTTNYEIVTYGADYTLSVLYEKMTNGEIEFPGFQRKFVWKLVQSSKLIESFLLGLPVPGIFLSKDKKTEKLLVVDGQQRLRTIKAFRNEIFPDTEKTFSLKSVKEKWEGKKYSDLETADRIRFDDSILRAAVIQQINPRDDDTSIYHIFERLNTGGTVLQSQEIRNCVYTGKFNDLLHELNQNEIWRKLYNQAKSKRRRDEELILRFLAFFYDLDNYKKPLNEFLSKFMENHRNLNGAQLNEMSNLFINVVNLIDKQIGPEAFRPARGLNMAAFDSVSVTIAKYEKKLRNNLKKQIKDLFKDEAYSDAIRIGTTDVETIKSRMKIAKEYLINE